MCFLFFFAVAGRWRKRLGLFCEKGSRRFSVCGLLSVWFQGKKCIAFLIVFFRSTSQACFSSFIDFVILRVFSRTPVAVRPDILVSSINSILLISVPGTYFHIKPYQFLYFHFLFFPVQHLKPLSHTLTHPLYAHKSNPHV
jgi:hypothetical protein